MEFKPFPKLARISREAVITEKLDGTNAQIYIVSLEKTNYFLSVTPGEDPVPLQGLMVDPITAIVDGFAIFSGSRTRWITPGKDSDNYGFAEWVRQNAKELVKLGPGQHFGEWMGCGINRNYNLSERRFYLFNTSRWFTLCGPPASKPGVYTQVKDEDGNLSLVDGPACCHVVPVIWRGVFDTHDVVNCVEMLRSQGSFAVPGFMQPEGVVVFHLASGQMFKKTLVADESPKSRA